ncbi:hypothetical protein, partial [Burkholderia ubonensis]|uniref:hypothetical protein n=1 Tax=Burkholderia ubonensis TaxID=101571 RepID=UPI002FC64D2C
RQKARVNGKPRQFTSRSRRLVCNGMGITIGSRGALLLLGRGILIMTGWEVALAVVAIQFLIWYFSDDDLQKWLEKCTFGRKSVNPAWDAGRQSDEFEKALKVMGLSADGTDQ